MSEETDKENRVTISSPDDILGDSPQRLQQEISIERREHMSMDEILKVIKEANGMPVLFVPSSDGRLAVVAVDGLQNLVVPTNRHEEGAAGKKQQDFRAWLLLLTSLVATVTYTAALSPPGGFWSADDKVNGYVAGSSVMRSKFHTRYFLFYYSNAIAFITSLMAIGMLAKSMNCMESTSLRSYMFQVNIATSFLSFGSSYVAGTWESSERGTFTIILMVTCGISMLAYLCQGHPKATRDHQ